MKRKLTIITDLDDDVLKYILILVAMYPDGAANLARAISVCKFFKKLVHEEEVLKVVAFDDVKVLDRLEFFQQYNGLLTRCAIVGNENAEYLFSKLILVSCSQLVRKERKLIILGKFAPHNRQCKSMTNYVSRASDFIADLKINQSTSIKVFSNNPLHNEVVGGFLCRCNPDEFFEMYEQIRDYFHYCIRGVDLSVFMEPIAKMYDSYAHLRDLKRIYTIIDNRNKQRIVLNQLELDRMERNVEKYKIFLREFHAFALLGLQLQLECQKRSFDFRLMFQGDLEELDGAHRKLIADFEMYRDHAISVINSFFM